MCLRALQIVLCALAGAYLMSAHDCRADALFETLWTLHDVQNDKVSLVGFVSTSEAIERIASQILRKSGESANPAYRKATQFYLSQRHLHLKIDCTNDQIVASADGSDFPWSMQKTVGDLLEHRPDEAFFFVDKRPTVSLGTTVIGEPFGYSGVHDNLRLVGGLFKLANRVIEGDRHILEIVTVNGSILFDLDAKQHHAENRAALTSFKWMCQHLMHNWK